MSASHVGAPRHRPVPRSVQGSDTLAAVDLLSREEFETVASSWDAGVAALGPGIDPFCSSTDWALPVLDTWGVPDDTLFAAADDALAVLAPITMEDGRLALMGPDVVWSYATATAGPTIDAAVAPFVPTALRAALDVGAAYLVLPGLVPGSPLEDALATALARHVERIGAGMEVTRHQADLVGSTEAFLARRSSLFRRNLRRAVRHGDAAGLVVEVLDDDPVDVAMKRVIDIETRSWKGREGSGLLGDRMGDGFTSMVRRLAATGSARIAVATMNGTDVGFILGGVRSGIYRGLQISFDDEFRRESIGHLLQWHEVQRCIATGMHTYDLGMPLEYKEHWADRQFVTRSLVVRPRLRGRR